MSLSIETAKVYSDRFNAGHFTFSRPSNHYNWREEQRHRRKDSANYIRKILGNGFTFLFFFPRTKILNRYIDFSVIKESYTSSYNILLLKEVYLISISTGESTFSSIFKYASAVLIF